MPVKNKAIGGTREQNEMRSELANVDKKGENASARPRLKKKKLRKKAKKTPEQKKLERLKKSFVSAARYVRQKAKDYVSASEKLELFGLMMQAKEGDFPVGSDDAPLSTSSLEVLKDRRWQDLRGTSMEEAMEKYVALVTKISPGWR